jgi:hypothetical protein
MTPERNVEPVIEERAPETPVVEEKAARLDQIYRHGITSGEPQ